MKSHKLRFLVLCLFFISGLFAQTVENNPLLFGNPSGACSEVSYCENYLMQKEEYTLSYNNTTLIPNWVCWHLSKENLGDASRGNKFKADNSLPKEWYHVTPSDYKYSAYGFDRGHVCPSADRTNTQQANDQTFLMTNMIPQSPDCNRIVWMHLENYEREIVQAGNEAYIFAGPAGCGGEGNRGIFEEILTMTNDGKSVKIKVPQWSWKIILFMPEGQNDVERVCNKEATVIAVCIPNKQGCQFDSDGNKIDWDAYKCSVDEIEILTGYDFFSLLPEEIQTVLEK